MNAPLLFVKRSCSRFSQKPNKLNSMSASWYYKNGENVTGPCESAQIKQAVAQGVIIAATQVRQGEDGSWFSASQVPGLLSPPPSFGGEQMTGKAYQVTKNFAGGSVPDKSLRLFRLKRSPLTRTKRQRLSSVLVK
ncbi:MAG: DUF4339 domain-containing protein [Planctomycetaceae bacterium]|jgi:hypothetical protein|nr:DUF4339 domain-containing protein [Planctomycetaceae bacterium]